MPRSATRTPWKAVEALREALREAYGPAFRGLWVFGSLARGEWTPDSDVDVLVLLDDALDPQAERERVQALARRVGRRRRLHLQALVRREGDFPTWYEPIAFNIRREGLFLLPNGTDGMAWSVERLMERAQRSLSLARRLLQQGYYEECVSRAYYAMFYAVSGALLSRGVVRSGHARVHDAFLQVLVRPGYLPKRLHRALVEAWEARLLADYSPEEFTERRAWEVLEEAEALVERIAQFLGEGRQ